MKPHQMSMLGAAAVMLLLCDPVLAVTIDTVLIGNADNDGELSGGGAGGSGPDRDCGAVGYVYDMGTYEVTAAEYCAFLNAVAKTDTYGLYNESMVVSSYGCRIERTGDAGAYEYSVAGDYADRPVNYVSWGDAARFSNWLANGQPTGLQDATTTEAGSYLLNGATSDAALLDIVREAGASWVIPTEDEWYKAAYHKNNGPTGEYFDYPTASDDLPSNALDLGGNNATYYGGDFTIGSPYFRTAVGAHENSESPYGTFDQGGNVAEWTEAINYGSGRVVRGGSYDDFSLNLESAYRAENIAPTSEFKDIGFRVVHLPEPGTVALLGFGLALLYRRR